MGIFVLQQCALLLQESMLTQSTLSETDRKRPIKFSASKGWIIGFVKRFEFQTVRLSGEDGSVDAPSIAKGMIALRKQLEEYDILCIFNVDETDLFYKLLLRQTHICQHEDRQSIKGTKAVKENDRITG